jgi:quercetin dioxygenase-like cupin family protein
MQRRSFLKTAAAILPAASLQAFALDQPSSASTEVHVIPGGEDRLGEAHSLGFSTICFKVLPSETSNSLFVIEHIHLTGGPDLHIHPHQEEYFYLLEGEVVFQVGDARKHLHPGDSVLAPRGISHCFAATNAIPSRMIIAFTPAGKMEQFFRETANLTKAQMTPEIWARYDLTYVGPSPLKDLKA